MYVSSWDFNDLQFEYGYLINAYSILGAYSVVDESDVTYNLIHLRDPSGYSTYTGPWSNSDTTNWTESTLA